MTFDGTPVLVPGAFATEPDANGHILMYPEGDASAPPSARIPNGGFYSDAIVRQEPLEGKQLDFEDNLEEFRPTSPAALAHMKREVELAVTVENLNRAARGNNPRNRCELRNELVAIAPDLETGDAERPP